MSRSIGTAVTWLELSVTDPYYCHFSLGCVGFSCLFRRLFIGNLNSDPFFQENHITVGRAGSRPDMPIAYAKFLNSNVAYDNQCCVLY